MTVRYLGMGVGSFLALITTAFSASASNWTNATGGAWRDAANWSGGVPTVSTGAFFNLEANYYITSTNGGEAGSMNFAAGNAFFDDIHLRQTDSSARWQIGWLAGQAAEVQMDQSQFDISGERLSIGQSGNGALFVEDHSLINVNNFVIVGGGGAGGGNGTLSLSGGSSMSISHSLEISAKSAGTMTLIGGSYVNAGSLQIGEVAGYTGTLSINDGSYVNVGSADLGSDGSGVSKGGAFANVQAGSSFHVTGTTKLWNANTLLNLNGATFTSGTLEVNGFAYANYSTLSIGHTLAISSISDGSLLLTNNSKTTADKLLVGAATGYTGTLSLTGGSLSVTSADIGGDGSASKGTGIVALSGGSVIVAGTTKVWNANSSLVLSGSAFTTGSLDLGGNSSALKWTAGLLEITSPITIATGTGIGSLLSVGQSILLPDQGITVGSNGQSGTLTVGGPTYYNNLLTRGANVILGSGSTSSGTLSLAGAASISGSLIVGDTGTGYLAVTGGNAAVTTLTIANSPGSTGYCLNNGYVSAQTLAIHPQGVFSQISGQSQFGTLSLSGGTFNLAGGSLSVTTVSWTDPASFNWTGGTFLALSSGAKTIPSLTVPSAGTLEIDGYGGVGTLNASGGVTSHGVIRLVDYSSSHAQAPSLAINGALSLDNNSQLIFNEYKSRGAGSTEFLKASSVAFAGTLTLNVLDNTLGRALPGDQFPNLVQYSSYTGDITIAPVPNYPNIQYLKTFSLTGLSISVVSTSAGDANLDGKVNIADLGVLATNYGLTGGWLQGDFNYDGVINIADLGLLATTYGTGSSGAQLSFADALAAIGLTNVPEPTTTWFITSATIGLLKRRRAA